MNKNTMEILNELCPNEVIKLKNKANLMNDIVKEMMDNVVENTNCMQEDKKYDEMIQFVNVQQDLNKVIECNNTFAKSNNIFVEMEQVISHNNYEVNVNEPHNLNECFRFKRPFAFQLKNHYQKAHTWKELLVKTCTHLYYLHPDKFTLLTEGNSMQWGNTFNFSKVKKNIREPIIIGDSGIYIETAKDSTGTRQLIIKMLNAFDIDIEEYKVFLRADYSPKRENDENYRKRVK